jgi:hypothetical protein
MKTLCSLKTVRTTLLVSLIALALGCGYSKKTTPVQAGTMPTITQLSPPSATANNPVALEVDGTSFASKAVINFNGAVMTTTFVNSTKLEATIPASAVMSAGAVPVTVTNPAVAGGPYGGGTAAETSSPMNFTVNQITVAQRVAPASCRCRGGLL